MDNGFQPSPQPNEIEANNYLGTTGQTLGKPGEEAVAQALPDAKSNLTFDGNASVVQTGAIQSKNYQPGVKGWILRFDGTAEFNQ